MIVYIFRHGIALNIGENGISCDGDRSLSYEGKEKTQKIAEALKELKCAPSRIICSPLIRARQTAEIAGGVLTPDTDPEISQVMEPSTTIESTTEWLSDQRDASIMLVGHNPNLEMLASYLISGTHSLDIRLKKASICRISFRSKAMPGEGTLEWLLQPAQLLKIGK